MSFVGQKLLKVVPAQVKVDFLVRINPFWVLKACRADANRSISIPGAHSGHNEHVGCGIYAIGFELRN